MYPLIIAALLLILLGELAAVRAAQTVCIG